MESYCLEFKCSSKSSRGEGLVPDAVMFRGMTFGKPLDHEGSDLRDGLLIHNPLWIHSWVPLGKGF
jgi:hypothetical protein